MKEPGSRHIVVLWCDTGVTEGIGVMVVRFEEALPVVLLPSHEMVCKLHSIVVELQYQQGMN